MCIDFSLTPSLDPATAAANLHNLLSPRIDPAPFQPYVRRLRALFTAFAASCPPPWPAPGLALTPEIHYQSELWLPLADIRPAFQRLFRAALRHGPTLSSTPFAAAASWAAIVAAYQPFFAESIDPAALLERLLADGDQRAAFLFRSFLPLRFYGHHPQRYPAQAAVITTWLRERHRGEEPIRCLDAACGDGIGSYGLARLLLETGYGVGEFSVDGWTIDPLEVWAAAHAAFPHDPRRQAGFRKWVAPVFARGGQRHIVFRAVDLLAGAGSGEGFDLILCNGLLGGPIIHHREELKRVAENLARLLRPGGLLLAADRFHGGWKKQVPRESLGDLLKGCGLAVREAGEGIAGLKTD
jgi:chemotaxis methyl-accepting protein methylase